MNNIDIDSLSVNQIASHVNNQTITAVEISNHFIRKIKDKNQTINAFIQFEKDLILEQARNIDKKVKEEGCAGSIAGVPVGIKDNFHVKGFNTTCCSRSLENYYTNTDASIVSKLKNAGAIIFGKTNMDEFAAGSTTESSCYGPTRNPLDTSCSPGGSSGGSAASVSAGLCPIAIGSDTGGSIRQPAALTGIVGFKPSYGAISRNGMVPLASSLDTPGILSKNVNDAISVAISVYGKCSSDVLSKNIYINERIKQYEKIEVGILKFKWADEETSRQFSQFVKSLRSSDLFNIKIISIPELEMCMGSYSGICCSEFFTNISRIDGNIIGCAVDSHHGYHECSIKSRSAFFSNEVKKRCIAGCYIINHRTKNGECLYRSSILAKSKIVSAIERNMENIDVLISPATPIRKIHLKQDLSKDIEPEDTSHHTDSLTVPANFAYLPSISIPYNNGDTNIPIGILINGKHEKDHDLLSIAVHIENHIQ
ncbi:MAG: hypothetical protein KAH32_01895 [Chlamydiia bacterium]|nr:hypothetical protein [Chlamydiia bacterium]